MLVEKNFFNMERIIYQNTEKWKNLMHSHNLADWVTTLEITLPAQLFHSRESWLAINFGSSIQASLFHVETSIFHESWEISPKQMQKK